MGKILHVAVGVIRNNTEQLLISLRHKTAPQGGLWEFPGGKVELYETVEQALKRELREELGISVHSLSPLIKIKHAYPEQDVLLDVWNVTSYSGEPVGRENQLIKWVFPNQITSYKFPEANYPIITATQLPIEYAILNGGQLDILLQNLNQLLENDIKLIQARVKPLSLTESNHFFEIAIPLCNEKGACLMINSAVNNAYSFPANGIHLTSKDLLSSNKRPSNYHWVSASCHNQAELQHAEKIAVDFVVLAPVMRTQSHPDTTPLGWSFFEKLVSETNLPVFALGGMKKQDINSAQLAGGHGISGISTFLNQ